MTCMRAWMSQNWPDSTMDYAVSYPSAYEKNKTNRLIINKTISSHFLQYFFSSPEPKAHR